LSIVAHAHPEKRLFISLLTRDISLADAFLDLLDNSINAAIRSIGLNTGSSEDYLKLLDENVAPKHNIRINFDANKVEINDDCGGISAADAQNNVFVFGASDGSHLQDKLSVYGIGLKRAMFKLGNKITMRSDHALGGFDLNLDVDEWRRKQQASWSFEISQRPPSARAGTSLKVTELYEGVRARLADPTFATELRVRISRAYSFFIAKVINIDLNGLVVEADVAKIGSNKASESFEEDGVSVSVSAGLGLPDNGGRYAAERAGWNVYCNGRSVISFDRSPLTGWGLQGGLPSFQPKHRPFVGSVFFTSSDPEKLPWTTTKLGVNTDNIVWQKAVRRMVDIGRQVTRFLDSRYDDKGTSITLEELSDAIGTLDVVKPTAKSAASTFLAPKKVTSSVTSIQYKVEKKVLERVKIAIGDRSMSNSDVGAYTFKYFINSELDDA